MKERIIPFVAVGLVAVGVVIVSDLFSFLSLGTFAWVAFILWNFTAKGESQLKKKQMLIRMISGLPIGLVLAICMLYAPGLFGDSIVAKYLIVFLCNGIAVLFPSSMVSGIFFGIGFTFSGLGVELMPDSLENIVIILAVMVIFSIVGMVAPWLTDWLTEKIQKISKKTEPSTK